MHDAWLVDGKPPIYFAAISDGHGWNASRAEKALQSRSRDLEPVYGVSRVSGRERV